MIILIQKIIKKDIIFIYMVVNLNKYIIFLIYFLFDLNVNFKYFS